MTQPYNLTAIKHIPISMFYPNSTNILCTLPTLPTILSINKEQEENEYN